jgi:hypothetical protein
VTTPASREILGPRIARRGPRIVDGDPAPHYRRWYEHERRSDSRLDDWFGRPLRGVTDAEFDAVLERAFHPGERP